MKAICIGCEQEFDDGLDEYYSYGDEDQDRQMFCDACQSHPITTAGRIIVKKSDMNILKRLLK